MSKKRLPLSVIQARGKKNLTKAEIETRKKHEERMRGNADKIIAPSHLTKKEKQEFEDISNQLVELGIFSNLDCDMLGMFITSKTEYKRVTSSIRNLKPVERKDEFREANETYLKLIRIKKSLFDECRSVANDLGLNVSSRLKLVVPKTEEKEESEFEKKFKNI